MIERITGAKMRHEVGSHGGRHIYFDRISAAEARDDLEFAKSVHRAHGLGLESFVFPRCAVGHLDIPAQSGFRVVRSHDVGLLRTANHRRDEQLATLGWFLERAADEAGRGCIEFATMGSYAAGAEARGVPARATI